MNNLSTEQLDRLRSMGIIIHTPLRDTCIVEQAGIQYPVSWRYLRRLATPSIGERLRRWMLRAMGVMS